VVGFIPQPIYPEYPSDRRLGGPQSWVWTLWRRKNLVPARIRTPAVQPIAHRYTDSCEMLIQDLKIVLPMNCLKYVLSIFIRSEVLSVVGMASFIFCDIMLHRLVKVNLYFGGTCCLRFKG
jgi:hypothetical protein